MTQPRAYHMRAQRARQQRAQQAKQRCLQRARERLQREQVRAQRALWTLEQALVDLDLPATIAEEVQWRLKTQQQLLGKIFGMMFPPCVWLPQLSGAVPGPGLGSEPARADLGHAAQAEMGQALATPGPGPAGAPVAARGRQKPRHPQSLAVDVGG